MKNQIVMTIYLTDAGISRSLFITGDHWRLYVSLILVEDRLAYLATSASPPDLLHIIIKSREPGIFSWRQTNTILQRRALGEFLQNVGMFLGPDPHLHRRA